MKSHLASRTALYNIWCHIKSRCTNSNVESFPYYGERGITVCSEWLHDFEAFRDWALKSGYRPGLSIDRFPDKLGNYEPNNCRWATMTQQQRNRTNNKPITFRGETLLISEFAERLGMKPRAVWARIKRGWPLERALTEPPREPRYPKRRSKHTGQGGRT